VIAEAAGLKLAMSVRKREVVPKAGLVGKQFSCAGVGREHSHVPAAIGDRVL
jgi:hypothetical protein